MLVLLADGWTDGWSTMNLFCVYRSSWRDPLGYIRLFGHVLGHANWEHFLNNMLLLLVVGPPMEEKYGSIPLLKGILFTALVTGVLQCILFPHTGLLGASGIVFMLIMLSSLAGFPAASRSLCCWWRHCTSASRCMISSLCTITWQTLCTSWAVCAVPPSAITAPSTAARRAAVNKKRRIIDTNGIPERLRTLRYPVYTRKKNNECDKLEVIYFSSYFLTITKL